MDLTPKQKKLIESLKSATKNDLILWGETADELSFRTVFNSGMVRVEKFTMYNSDQKYQLVIFNKEGYEVDRFTWEEPEVSSDPNLWQLARRKAMNSESLIDGILQELEGKLVS